MGKLQFFHFLLLEIAETSCHFFSDQKWECLNPKFGSRLLKGCSESLKKIVAITLTFFTVFFKWHLLPSCYQRVSIELLRYVFVRYMTYAESPWRLIVFFYPSLPAHLQNPLF